MKYMLLLFGLLLTSCASIGLNVGSDTTNNSYINNGTLNITNYITSPDTVYRTDTLYNTANVYVDPYTSRRYSSYDDEPAYIGSSLSDNVGATWSFTAYAGQAMIDTTKDGNPYTFGLSIGGEGYLYSSEQHFRAGLVPAIRWIMINESAYRTLHFIQLEIMFKLSFGNMRNRGYLMGGLSTNLSSQAKETYKRYSKIAAQMEFNSAMAGVEFGYTHLYPSKHSFDLFLRVDQSPYRYTSNNADVTVCLFGIRYNL